MGCDITVHTEVRIKGVWHHYSAPYVLRSYRTFNALAGVRDQPGWAPPRFPPRGLPSDMSEPTRLCYDADQGHTPSYLSLEELVIALGLPDPYHEALERWQLPDAEGFEAVRVVFWFDN